MSDSLPLVVDPWLLFRRNCEIAGKLPLTHMPNLQSSQNREAGDADVRMSVLRREDRQIVIEGDAEIELELMCQRCLSSLVMTVKAEFELALIKFEHQLSFVNGGDDVVICEDNLDLPALIEQEIILSMPMIAKHKSCEMASKNTVKEDTDSHQPFANLKDLLS